MYVQVVMIMKEFYNNLTMILIFISQKGCVAGGCRISIEGVNNNERIRI